MKKSGKRPTRKLERRPIKNIGKKDQQRKLERRPMKKIEKKNQ